MTQNQTTKLLKAFTEHLDLEIVDYDPWLLVDFILSHQKESFNHLDRDLALLTTSVIKLEMRLDKSLTSVSNLEQHLENAVTERQVLFTRLQVLENQMKAPQPTKNTPQSIQSTLEDILVSHLTVRLIAGKFPLTDKEFLNLKLKNNEKYIRQLTRELLKSIAHRWSSQYRYENHHGLIVKGKHTFAPGAHQIRSAHKQFLIAERKRKKVKK